jgi:thiopeptide-type bacteriocin biosynthesis protein
MADQGRKVRVLSPVLVRGPLCPLRALGRAELLAHPLGPAALTVASRDLGAALATGAKRATPATRATLDRYSRRAAFRATPSGLLAGVALVPLGDRTRLASGAATPALRPSWGRLSALGRGLLDETAVRAQVTLRLCPSLLRGGDEWVWLAFEGEGEGDGVCVRSAAPDGMFAALADALGAPLLWPVLRARLHAAGLADDDDADADTHGDDANDAIDDWLLQLIDQGLLCHDLEPPLVGPPPLDWLHARLRLLRTGAPEDAAWLAEIEAGLSRAQDAAARLDVAGARAALGELPGVAAGAELHATLGLTLAGTVARRAVERGAALAPLLFRLQEATAAPGAERVLDEALLLRLSGAAEHFGAGALDFTALALGGYGARLIEGDDGDRQAPACDPALLAYLVEALTAAAATGVTEMALSPEELDGLLPAGAPPPTFELSFAPTREAPRAAPGTGWLLGHHGPAGASLGRFAETLGAPMTALLAAIAEGEAAARPGEQALDVVHAAGRARADLSAHPPVRRAALALTGWPAAGIPAVTPAELALVVDEAAAQPLALRASPSESADGLPVAPSPLARVRSTTLPPGLYRLLAGWSLHRQHTPWSFVWPAALANLPFLPRVVLDGFVIAPASWALPPPGQRHGRTLRRFRAEAPGLPRWVQIGHGDELLPVDLDAPTAADDLERHAGARVFEIWPPVEAARLVDAGGRRLEVIAAVISEDEAASHAIAATAAAGVVPPPVLTPPADWLTFRLYGAREHQDAVLFEVVAPLVAAARAAGELAQWFFLRYVEPGAAGRDHVRLRLRAAAGKDAALRRRVRRAITPARQAGLLVAVDETDYFRETARYGGPAALAAAEALFEASSELLLALLAAEEAGVLEPDDDRLALLVRAQDALARGLALDLAARRALAERRRAAFARTLGAEVGAVAEALKRAFRQRQRTLFASLGADQIADAEAAHPAALFAAYARAVAAAYAPLSAEVRARLHTAVPALLHMQAVRLIGLHPEDERASYVFWARALEGLSAQKRR